MRNLVRKQRKLNNIVSSIENEDTIASLVSDANGRVKFAGLDYGMYDLRIGGWGYENKCFDSLIYNCDNDTNLYILNRKDEDFFEVDLGWTVSGNEQAGAWTIADPIGTVDRFFVANPGADVGSDCGSKAIVTGNGLGSADLYDVDSTTILTSPSFDLRSYIEPYLVFYSWFYNGGDQPNDQLLISLIDTAGNVQVIDTVANRGVSGRWDLHNIKVSNYMDKGALDRIQFEVSDRGDQHILEAAVDHFFVSEGEYIGLDELDLREEITVYPNPFENEIYISSSAANLESYQLFDASLRLIQSARIQNKSTRLNLPSNLESGMYFIQIRTAGGEMISKKMIKQ